MRMLTAVLLAVLLSACSVFPTQAAPSPRQRAAAVANRACQTQLWRPRDRGSSLGMRDQLAQVADLAGRAAALDRRWQPLARAYSDYALAWHTMFDRIQAAKDSAPVSASPEPPSNPWRATPPLPDAARQTISSSCRRAWAAHLQ